MSQSSPETETLRQVLAEPTDRELKSFGYAPGNYMSRCLSCDQIKEEMDKRAITCRPCAVARYKTIVDAIAVPADHAQKLEWQADKIAEQDDELQRLRAGVAQTPALAPIFEEGQAKIAARLDRHAQTPVVTDEMIIAYVKAADGYGVEKGSFLWEVTKLGLEAALSISSTLQSAPVQRPPQNIAERLPSSDAAGAGADTGCICQNQHRRGYCTEPGCSYSSPLRCESCDQNYADPPSKLCPGCQAYQEHQR